MLSYTVKATIKALQQYCGTSELTLKMHDPKEGLKLEVSVKAENVVITYDVENCQWISRVNDIEMLSLPTNMLVTEYIEKKDTGEITILPINFENQLFVHVFKLMKGRVNFSMDSRLGKKQAVYLNRKMYLVEEEEGKYVLRETNLYKFHKMYGDYSITAFSPVTGKLDTTSLIEKNKEIARTIGKPFQLVKD